MSYLVVHDHTGPVQVIADTDPLYEEVMRHTPPGWSNGHAWVTLEETNPDEDGVTVRAHQPGGHDQQSHAGGRAATGVQPLKAKKNVKKKSWDPWVRSWEKVEIRKRAKMDESYRDILKEQGILDELPQVVTQSDYDALSTQEVFHGVYKAEAPGVNGATPLLAQYVDGTAELYVSPGIIGSGRYFSTNRFRAEQYSLDDQYGAVLTAKLHPDAKVIHHGDLQDLMSEVRRNAPWSDEGIYRSAGHFAAALGYDAIEQPMPADHAGRPESFVNVLNRGALIVSENRSYARTQ